MEPEQDLTLLIARASERDSGAAEALFDVVYSELRGIAGSAMRAQRAGHTLQPTALVNEVWLKLAGNLENVSGRVHFFATAARAMRHVLRDHARARNAQKRGEGIQPSSTPETLMIGDSTSIDLLQLEDLFARLGELNARHGQVAELRILGGLNLPEVAEVLGVSLRTAESDWRLVRAWLRVQYEQDD